MLDVLARTSLWNAGLDYGHGTGHGVGACLNVHEGPHGIAPRYGNTYPLKPGMIVSNEPGYYHDGAFGIRIENLLYVVPASAENGAPEGCAAAPHASLSTREAGALEVSSKSTSPKKFLRFERLTKVPIHRALINVALLSPKEVAWVDKYHAEVRRAVEPLLQGGNDGKARKWLLENTKPLG